MTEHEKARLEAAIARGKLRESRDASREGQVTAVAFRDPDAHDGYAPSRIVLQKKPPPRK